MKSTESCFRPDCLLAIQSFDAGDADWAAFAFVEVADAERHSVADLDGVGSVVVEPVPGSAELVDERHTADLKAFRLPGPVLADAVWMVAYPVSLLPAPDHRALDCMHSKPLGLHPEFVIGKNAQRQQDYADYAQELHADVKTDPAVLAPPRSQRGERERPCPGHQHLLGFGRHRECVADEVGLHFGAFRAILTHT